VLALRAERELSRARALGERGAMTAAEAEDLALAWRSAVQRVETERRELALLEARARGPEITVAERRADETLPDVERRKLDLARTRVVAPLDAVVAKRTAEAGEIVAAGSAVYTLIDRSSLWVELVVDARTEAELVVGQPVTVQAEASDLAPVPGRVAYIADRHSFTTRPVDTPDDRALLAFRVKVALDTAPGPLKPGMFAVVRINPP
jgi:multidrug resistance efflux pump